MILYIDTSSNYLHSALLKENKLLDKISKNFNKDLSKYALSCIDKMLKNNNCTIDNIDKIIVINGPGSFTGIRIGLTIAKTIAWAKKIKIIEISSLMAMSLSVKDKKIRYVVPIIDARRGFVYSGIYDNINKCYVLKEQYLSLNTLHATLKTLEQTNVENDSIIFVTNDNIETTYKVIDYIPDFENIVLNTLNNEPINPHLVDANYLKLTEAEEKKNDC